MLVARYKFSGAACVFTPLAFGIVVNETNKSKLCVVYVRKRASVSGADGAMNVSMQNEEDSDQSDSVPMPIPIPMPAPNDQNDAEKVWDSMGFPCQ